MIKSLFMQQEKYDELFVFSPTINQLENISEFNSK
jgi:hypothetical protein